MLILSIFRMSTPLHRMLDDVLRFHNEVLSDIPSLNSSNCRSILSQLHSFLCIIFDRFAIESLSFMTFFFLVKVRELGTFYSKSQVIKHVVTSSTHAELRALYLLTTDILFVINLCDELYRPLQLPSIVFVDNQPLIDLVEATTPRPKRSKHFLMLVDFIRDQVASGYLQLKKVPSIDNIADILTKIVTGNSFQRKRDILLGH